MKCRKVQNDVETRGNSLTWDKPGGWPDCCPGGIRHEGGVTLNQASLWNAGTCRPDVKGETQIGGPYEGEITDAGHRGGALPRITLPGPRLINAIATMIPAIAACAGWYVLPVLILQRYYP
jgi:hypothetical protein